MADDRSERARRNLHGRRRGHRLRPRQRELLDRHLPNLEIKLPNEGGPVDPADWFDADSGEDVWLEIGFGAGEHLAAQATTNPHCRLIGCEPYVNGIARFLVDWQARELTNVKLFLDDARLLLAALPPASIARIFLMFPDPWPKRRHHKRRIIGPDTLSEYERVLRDDGELRFATDHADFCRWALFYILGCGSFSWRVHEAADWRLRPEDWPETRYEQKALSQGRRSTYLSFARRPR